MIAVVVVLVAGGAAFFILGGDDTAGASAVAEPAGSPGEDPFTSSMAVVEVAEFPGDVTAVIDETRDSLPSSDGVLVASGTTPGLYGGSQNESVCDPALMVDFLEANRAEAEAWAGVLGIDPDTIPDYVASLTSVVLTNDTWVTNHGFSDGRATPRQSVLQAGTAVMVDDQGVPRVKCGCGNPLLPPEGTGSAPNVSGDTWDGFDPNAVAVVDPGSGQDTLRVIDVETGEEFDQRIGTPVLVLESDGLGVVQFGIPFDEAVQALTAVLGPGEESGDASNRHVTWGDIRITSINTGPVPTFEVYRVEGSQPAAATPQGIAFGSTLEDVLAAYPNAVQFGSADSGEVCVIDRGAWFFMIEGGVVAMVQAYNPVGGECGDR